jgi:hypothetical protein
VGLLGSNFETRKKKKRARQRCRAFLYCYMSTLATIAVVQAAKDATADRPN